MELVNRYVHTVVHQLPEHQKADIEKELRSLIEDMLEARTHGGDPAEKDVEEVLLELGDPRELADRYRGGRRYLIGPDLFPTYWSVLRIVMVSIGIAMAAVFAVETLVQPNDMPKHIASSLVSLFMALVQGFAWVTLIFGYAEYAGMQEKWGMRTARKAWKPSDLPPVPDPSTRISRGEIVTGIIFSVLAFVLFTFSLDLFGIWVLREGSYTVIPFFDEAVFRQYLPFIWPVLAIGLLNECFKLISGKWTLKLVALELLVILLQLILASFLFADTSVWNPGMLQGMVDTGLLEASGESYRDMHVVWERLTGNFVYLVGVVIMIQLVTLGAKAYKLRGNIRF